MRPKRRVWHYALCQETARSWQGIVGCWVHLSLCLSSRTVCKRLGHNCFKTDLPTPLSHLSSFTWNLAMFRSFSPLHRVIQISRQFKRPQNTLSTMPLIAQNPQDRVILGLMTFGTAPPLTPPRPQLSSHRPRCIIRRPHYELRRLHKALGLLPVQRL